MKKKIQLPALVLLVAITIFLLMFALSPSLPISAIRRDLGIAEGSQIKILYQQEAARISDKEDTLQLCLLLVSEDEGYRLIGAEKLDRTDKWRFIGGFGGTPNHPKFRIWHGHPLAWRLDSRMETRPTRPEVLEFAEYANEFPTFREFRPKFEIQRVEKVLDGKF